MKENPIIGIPAPRVEGEEKVSGRAIYAVDVVMPGMLWAKVLRSPIAHGRIKRIDARRAIAAPGVKAVITGEDLAGVKIGKKIIDMPLLAVDRVRFIGEKVAAVAAETPEAADEALERIEVEYEEWPAVCDPLEALKPSAPLVHPEVMHYAGLLHPLEKPSNLFVHLASKKGDIEDGFNHSDLIVENSFITPRVHQAYIEPHACVVQLKEDGGAEVWCSSKSPFSLRDQVARAFQLSPGKLVIHPSYIGGDFGGKGDSNDVALCYVLSRKSGRPVKMVMDYREEFLAGNPRHSSIIQCRTGVKRNGLVMAVHIRYVFDSGAYGAFRPQGFLVGARDAVGPYRISHVLVEEDYVYTNQVPCGYMRAPGHVQGHFAAESQMDLVAEALGMEPIELRKLNFMRDGDEMPTGETATYIRAEETLEKALVESHYRASKGKNVGRGCGVAQWMSKGGESYAFVTIGEDGSVTLSSAVLDVGPGAYTIMRQIVAEELKIPVDSIKVEMLDTTKVRTDSGVRGSSSTRVHGGAAYEAGSKAKEEILRLAAEFMRCAPDELILYDGGVIHGRMEKRMTFAEIARAKGSPIVAEGHYANMKEGPESSMVAQVAEVKVDPETGEISLTQLTTAHSVGTILNPITHQGQIDGGVVMGVGYGMMEEMVMEEGGKVATAHWGDYKIPTPMDIPPLKTVILPSTTGSGPYHSMSIGETALMPTAAAIANAVADAVGVRIRSLPITAEKVLRALRSRENGPL